MDSSLEQAKSLTPPYGSFKTLVNFSNDVREGGHVPLQIDRSVMPKLSGSAQFETIAALRFLGLVAGDKTVKPTPLFEKFVMAADQDRPEVLRGLLHQSYNFLLGVPELDIERASGQQVNEIFRQQGLGGSTIGRAISFFLAAAKEAGIKVSHNVKRPAKTASNGSKSKREKKLEVPSIGQAEKVAAIDAAEQPPSGTQRFELPIPGKASVTVWVPETLDADDWEMLTNMFGLYVARWKRYPMAKPEGS